MLCTNVFSIVEIEVVYLASYHMSGCQYHQF